MRKVFVGGSRSVRKLDDEVRRRIERIVASCLPVIVGDAAGADKAAQQLLLELKYDSVEVFHSGRDCRNNLAAWPTRSVAPSAREKGYRFFAAKDQVMADEAAYGLMIWDGESFGTVMNVFRLARQRKPVVVYLSRGPELVEVRNAAELDRFIARHAKTLRPRIERETQSEARSGASALQTNLL